MAPDKTEDVVLVVSCVAGIIAFVCATGTIAAYFAYTYFGRDPKAGMRALVAAGGIVLWVRVRSGWKSGWKICR